MSEPEKTETPRTNSLPWIVLSGIVGLFAVGTPHQSGSNPAPKAALKQDQPDDQGVRKPHSNQLLKTIEEFHATHDDRWNPDDLAKSIRGYDTEFVIATVPDPIDTPFGYAFDQSVDAIQRAIQQKNGYVLDRAWLPWEVDRKTKPAPGAEISHLHDNTPGVLLFRHGKDTAKGVKKPGLCIVFLVGETPFSGIHKRAFWKCLNVIWQAGLPESEPVRVVGPYFTGSQTSLQFLIDDWLRSTDTSAWLGLPRPNKFKVIVGNASGMRTKDFFHETWGRDRIEIASTVLSGRVQVNAILHFLAERDGARTTDTIGSQTIKKLPGSIAILAESNTGFGKQFTSYGEQNDIVVLRFPLHVARLKSEYAQLFRKQDEQSGLQSTTTVSPAGFEDAGGARGRARTGRRRDGRREQCRAREHPLDDIARALRYVGVMATDTRDKLFLIRLIREYCPDVHVFVTQTDLLLTHPDYLYHMKGVVVGSTYPLYPPNQQWVRPNAPERLLLSSTAAQGYYNATLAILGLHDQMLEYGPPGFAAGPGVPNDRPPVWVSMVAPNGTLVPLQLFTGYEDPNGYVWRKPNPGDIAPATGLQFPGSLYLVGLALVGFWFVLIVKCWRRQHLWAVDSVSGPASHAGVFRTVLLGAQMIIATAMMAVTSARIEHTNYESPGDIAAFAVLAIVWVLFLLTAMHGVSFHRPATTGPDSRRWRWDVVNLVIILGLVAFTVCFLGRFWTVSDRPHRALFFVRAVDLASGLSPLTPLFLMCMAVTAGAYFQLERRELARRSRVPSPFPPDSERVFDRLTDQDRRLKVEMTPGRFWKRYRLTLIGLFIALSAAGTTVWRDSLPTVEGNVWDVAFAIGFASIYVFVALTILQTVLLWRQTKQLLVSVAQLPLMRVFVRLPARITGIITKNLYTRSTQPLMLQMAVHQLRALADTANADPTAPEPIRNLGPIAAEAETRLQNFTNPPHGKPCDPGEEAALRELLSKAASHGLEALSPRWKSLPTDELFGGAPVPPVAGATAPLEPAWVSRAEELVGTQTVNYLSQFFIQLRSLMLAVLVCSSLLLVSATSYPFHPERLLLVFLLGLVGAGLASVVYVFLDMSRDETVSRVSRSSGRFSFDSGFITSFFTYIVPTVGLLAAQLSGTFRWALEPILRVVK